MADRGIRWVYLLTIPVLVTIDQVTKRLADGVFGGSRNLVPGLLRVETLRHRGGFFGLIEMSDPGWGWLLVALTGLALGLLVIFAAGTPATRPGRHLGFACMIGGALGNLACRLIYGYVLDFLAIGPLPLFNLADVWILAGMILIGADAVQPRRGAREGHHASRSV